METFDVYASHTGYEDCVYTIHTMYIHRSVHVYAPQIRDADCLDPSHHEHQECLCRSHQDSDQTL